MCLRAGFLFPLKGIGESLPYLTSPLRSVIGNYSFHIKDGSPVETTKGWIQKYHSAPMKPSCLDSECDPALRKLRT